MAGRRVRSGGAYHHGDLRAAVIAAGLKRLAKRDGVTIGLRALSRDVGVSATALYRYFPDKEALFDALADEGLRRLGAQQAQAWVKAGGGRASFLAAGIAYIRFAHDDPELFRLSFTRGKGLRSREQGGDGAEVAYNLPRAGIAQSLPHFEDQADSAALHAWALVHGAAMLILDRPIDWDEALIADVVGLTFGGAD